MPSPATGMDSDPRPVEGDHDLPRALVWDNESAVGSWRGGRPVGPPAFGRSAPKVHLCCDGRWQPLSFTITAGQAGDNSQSRSRGAVDNG